MTLTDALAGLAILVGIVGIVVPVLPGTSVIAAAVLVWAIVVGTVTGWVVFAVAAAALVAGGVVKYLVPGKRMKDAGVPGTTMWWGAAGAAVGFFVIPLVGVPAGFVVGIYGAEHARVGPERAWPSTRSALEAVALSIGIELVAACIATWTWIAGVVLT